MVLANLLPLIDCRDNKDNPYRVIRDHGNYLSPESSFLSRGTFGDVRLHMKHKVASNIARPQNSSAYDLSVICDKDMIQAETSDRRSRLSAGELSIAAPGSSNCLSKSLFLPFQPIEFLGWQFAQIKTAGSKGLYSFSSNICLWILYALRYTLNTIYDGEHYFEADFKRW